MKVTPEQLKARQAWDLETKILFSRQRIHEWYNYWSGRVYVSFSGGKDSTVLLHLVRSLYSNVPAVFCDTGLEYPEIRRFVKEQENVTWIRPAKRFDEVIEKYGYPVISKEIAHKLHQIRQTKSETFKKSLINKIPSHWIRLISAPFKVSEVCCHYLKKKPFMDYERHTTRKPIIGTMTEEARLRMIRYIREGCNAFDISRPKSAPLSIWLENDISEYIKLNNLKISPIYQTESRTGCMFCMFGVHMEEVPNRFQRMLHTHPKQYDYCINTLGLGKVLDYINVPYREPMDQMTIFDLYNRKVVTTRKEHRCEVCGKTINAGKKAVFHSGKWDGEFDRYYLHLCCQELANEVVEVSRECADQILCQNIIDAAIEYDIIKSKEEHLEEVESEG